MPLVARTARQDKVRELQRTLYRAAKADPGRRFHALYDKVYRSDVLERAWELVRANRGAAGIDRQTIADVEQYGVAKLLDELAADLKDGQLASAPCPPGVHPEARRPDEQRPLSIPTITAYGDVVQGAFGFVGGHASVSSAARAAAGGSVRASATRTGALYVCEGGRLRNDRRCRRTRPIARRRRRRRR